MTLRRLRLDALIVVLAIAGGPLALLPASPQSAVDPPTAVVSLASGLGHSLAREGSLTSGGLVRVEVSW